MAERDQGDLFVTRELPPGHVRMKSTGEIGKVQAIDSKAGIAKVFWLRRGQASTVRLADVTRKPR